MNKEEAPREGGASHLEQQDVKAFEGSDACSGLAERKKRRENKKINKMSTAGVETCIRCAKRGTVRCSRCKAVYYCSPQCQKEVRHHHAPLLHLALQDIISI